MSNVLTEKELHDSFLQQARTKLIHYAEAHTLEGLKQRLLNLIDEGKIEFHKVGTHRRVLFKSALAYKRQIAAERRAVLAELAAYDQELGI